MRKIKFISILLIVLASNLYSQPAKIDSLKRLIYTNKPDSTQSQLFFEIAMAFGNNMPDSVLVYLTQSLTHAVLAKNVKFTIKVLNAIGNAHIKHGDFDLAKENFNKVLLLGNEINDKACIANAYRSIGQVYGMRTDFNLAIDYFSKAIKMGTEINDVELVNRCKMNIGLIHYDMGNFDKAIVYFKDAIKVFKELNNEFALALCYNNLANAYKEKVVRDVDKLDFNQSFYVFKICLDYYHEGLNIFKKRNDYFYLSMSYTNIGIVHKELYFLYLKKKLKSEAEKEINTAFDCYLKALKYSNDIGNKNGIMQIYRKIAYAKNAIGAYKEAIKYGLLSLKIAEDSQTLQDEIYCHGALFEAYDSLGDYKKAYYYLSKYAKLSDSLYNIEKNKEIMRIEAVFQNEKKQLQIDNLQKENLIKEKSLLHQQDVAQRQWIIIIFALIFIILISFFAFFIVNRLRLTRKQNKIIEEQRLMVIEKNAILSQQNEEIRSQRDEIENQRDEITAQRDMVMLQKDRIEKQKFEITNSIKYAKQIQQAVLPSKAFIDNILKEYFIFYKPKDIVSGDFYWLTQINKNIVFTVADCTGHGVPGAFMSMLGVSFLNEIVIKKGVIQPNEILNQLRSSIIDSLHQQDKSSEQKDGMDISLCVLDTETKILSYAGTYNPIYIVNKNDELLELKGDSMPVGISNNMSSFTNFIIQLQEGDSIFLSSDGYKDQFGGPKDKKFMSKQFKQLLCTLAHKPVDEQYRDLESVFNEWKRNHEQIDDVTVLGIKI